MIRELVSRISGMLATRSHSMRQKHQASVKIWFDPIRNMAKTRAPAESIFMMGETCDLSGSGIGFIVSAIRIKENYLVGQDRLLNAEISLPDGKIRMKIMGRRYEKVGIHVSTEKYVIGAEIVDMSKADKEAYEYFLRHGSKQNKIPAGSLELGID